MPSRSRWSGGMIAVGALVVLLVVVAVVVLLGRHDSESTPVVAPRKIVKIVIPEGETRPQIGEIADAKGMTGSYVASSAQSTVLDPGRYGAPADTPSLEGFLFPATYEVYAGSPAAELVGRQLEAFEERFGPKLRAAARALGETPYQLLIVASMVEREAETERDRPLVAAVIYNRLRLGMELGIDATIRYALHDYSQPLTEAQLHTQSPYNTRLHRGLPPTPISNPGMASIEAAAHPARASYLYYVAAANGCGDLVFSDSYSEFLQDATAYQQALADNGGRVPRCVQP
jgi:cell division protein YceG involved in septum cleavage